MHLASAGLVGDSLVNSMGFVGGTNPPTRRPAYGVMVDDALGRDSRSLA